MSMYDTSNLEILDREVVEEQLLNNLITKLDMNQFITMDYQLAENPGMLKKIRKYTGKGAVEDLDMGEGNSQTVGSEYSEETYRVAFTQGKLPFYDEQAMADPKAIDKAVEHLSELLTNDMTVKIVEELAKGSNIIYDFDFGFNAFVDAIASMPDENPGALYILVSKKDLARIQKKLATSLQYVEDFARKGYVGTVAGVPIYMSNAIGEGEAYLATREAVSCFMKKGVEVKTERDEDHRKTTIYGRNCKVIALTDDTKVVILNAGESPNKLVSNNSGVSIAQLRTDANITGTNVVWGVSHTDEFPAAAIGSNDVIEVNIKDIMTVGAHTVKQINPALALFADDPSVQHIGNDWVKEKSYNMAAKEDYDFILLKGAGKAEVIVDGEKFVINYNLA